MRKRFRAHFSNSEGEIKQTWQIGCFVFDANTMLNLYRYSDNTRKEFLQVLRQFKDRVRLPEQAAHEFFRSRLSEIATQERAYEDARKQIENLKNCLLRERGHPFISEGMMEKLSSLLDKVSDELQVNQKAQSRRINDDEIMSDLAGILEGKVGEALSEQELAELFSEGKARFEQKIPPGYEDAKKFPDPKNDREKNSVFGDLIVWKQTIKFAQTEKCPVIFVTDDTKEDWWLEVQGKTVGPRPELVEEFHKETGQTFLMYRPEQFIRFAKDHLDSNVSSATIEEIATSPGKRDYPDADQTSNGYSSSAGRRVARHMDLHERHHASISRRRARSEMEAALERENARDDIEIMSMSDRIVDLKESISNIDAEILSMARLRNDRSFSDRPENEKIEIMSQREYLLHRRAMMEMELNVLQKRLQIIVAGKVSARDE